MRVALVHDWLTGMRGGEKVLEVLCELYPDADLFTLFHKRGCGLAADRAPPHRDLVRPAPAVCARSATGTTCRCSRWPSGSSASTATTW